MFFLTTTIHIHQVCCHTRGRPPSGRQWTLLGWAITQRD